MVGKCGLLALLALAGCKKPIAEAPPEPIPEEAPAATPAPARPPPATPAPHAVATPAPNYLAPAGVFFLMAKTSVETADGITGLRPGTQLEQTASNEYTAPGGHQLTLRPDQVTNDLRIARQVAGADVAAQQALRQAYTPRTPTRAAAAATTPRPAPLAANPPPVARPSTALSGSGALGASHTRVKDGYVWEKDGRGTWIRVRPVRN